VSTFTFFFDFRNFISIRRETWIYQSAYKLWDTIVQDTRTHVKYHTIMSDVCGKYMFDKFNEIAEDTRRMFMKVKIRKILKTNENSFCFL
jgi:hypothetical protein